MKKPEQISLLGEIIRTGEIPNFTEGSQGKENKRAFQDELKKLDLPELMDVMDLLITKMENY